MFNSYVKLPEGNVFFVVLADAVVAGAGDAPVPVPGAQRRGLWKLLRPSVWSASGRPRGISVNYTGWAPKIAKLVYQWLHNGLW